MTALVFYTLTMFGIAYVAGHSVISLPAREVIAVWSQWLITMIECPACLGWWLGLVSGLIFAFTGWRPFGPAALGIVVTLPFYTAGANYLLARATGLIPNPQEPKP
jgi:predicted ABC-type sugar transport system permease subunit